jgi:hypothetical protein
LGAAGYAYHLQRQRAAAAAEAEVAAAFLGWSIAGSNSAQGGHANMTVRQMVERAVDRIDRVPGLSGNLRTQQLFHFAWFLHQEGQTPKAVEILNRIAAESNRASTPAQRAQALTTLAWLHQPADCPAALEYWRRAQPLLTAHGGELKPMEQLSAGLLSVETRSQCAKLSAGSQYREYARLTPLVERITAVELLAGGISRKALQATMANHTVMALLQMKAAKPDALAEADRVAVQALAASAGDPDAGFARMQLLVSHSRVLSAAGDTEGSARAAGQAYQLALTSGGPFDRLRLHTIWGAQLARGKDRTRAVEVLGDALRQNWAHEKEVSLAWTNNITAAYHLALYARDCSLVPEALGHVREPVQKMERVYRAQYRLADGICRIERSGPAALRQALDESVAEGALSRTSEAYRFSDEILAGKR